jgi:hypothetical protein
MNHVEGQENIVRPVPVVMIDVCHVIPDILGQIVNVTPKFQIQNTALTTLPMTLAQILTMQLLMEKLVVFSQKLQELF